MIYRRDPYIFLTIEFNDRHQFLDEDENNPWIESSSPIHKCQIFHVNVDSTFSRRYNCVGIPMRQTLVATRG